MALDSHTQKGKRGGTWGGGERWERNATSPKWEGNATRMYNILFRSCSGVLLEQTAPTLCLLLETGLDSWLADATTGRATATVIATLLFTLRDHAQGVWCEQAVTSTI